MKPANQAAPQVEITLDPARINARAAHAFLSTSRWAAGISLELVQKSLAHSLCAAAFVGNEQVGLVRLVTDRATFAYVADVYVLPAYRGHGLSKKMLDAVFAHPEMQGLRRMLLVTRDAHTLYEQYGFRPLAHPERFMERHDPDVYARAATRKQSD
jgi:GNAT superfamily N-acetyltransferase